MSSENPVPNKQEKAETSKSTEELVKLVENKGVELTDEQLQAISGGAVWDDDGPTEYFTTCHYCGKKTYWYADQGRPKNCPYCEGVFFFE